MKKWTKEEVSALCASVAELGHSKGIRQFVSSADNIQGRTFNGCEYMLQKQRRMYSLNSVNDALCEVSTKNVNRDDKKPSLLRRIFGFIFKRGKA